VNSRFVRIVPTLTILGAVMLVALLGAGCAGQSESESEEDQGAIEGTSDSGGEPVLMLGRSVMWGWFKHWGWDGAVESLPIGKSGYSLTYGEMQEPPAIADSAMEFMDEAPEGSIVFFKFCFVDFHGGEDSTFEDQKQWVEQVADKAEERDQLLIVGNALPKTDSETDAALVAEHERFNEWLEDFASERDGKVWVYDFYGVLADSGGAIKESYASAPDDPHPNDEAYSELDPSLFDLLDEVAR